jgi:hypothetical protein
VAADLREIGQRYALAEHVSIDVCLYGMDELPQDAALDCGLVATVAARRGSVALLVVESHQGRGWWFLGWQGVRKADRHGPFLVGFAGWEKIERAEADLGRRGR